MGAISRRELIQAVLGVSAAASAAAMTGCNERVLPLQGELLAPDFEFGHRLRSGYKPVPAETDWQDVSVVIVGAGVAGLAAGWGLLQAGFHDFVILELESHAGGTSRSGTSGAFTFPWAAHYITAPLPENVSLIKLLREMNVVEEVAADGTVVVAEQCLCREPEERVYCDGAWVEGLYPTRGASEEDLRQLREFHESMVRWSEKRDEQGRRFFALPIAHCSDSPEVLALDKLSMAEWVKQQGWDSPRLLWYVEYACRDDYGLTLEGTSAWAAILYFAARLRYGSTESQDVITWPAGNGHIVEHLRRRLEGKLRLGQPVCNVVSSADPAKRLDSRIVAFDKQHGVPVGYRADRVIFAAPQFLAPHVIEGFGERRGKRSSEFRYSAWLVANVHLRLRPRESGFPMSWDNVIYGSKSLGYVVSTHQTGLDHGPTVLTWYYPFCDIEPKLSREQLMRLGWQQWADLVLADLSVGHPDIRSFVTRVDIMRWGHAMVQPYPGFVWSDARRQATEPDGSIHFANTDLSGIALLEEAFHHGLRAADEVLALRA